MEKSGVFIVEQKGKEYIVKSSGKVVFQGDEAGYDVFVKENKQSVFIIDDIPRSIGE